MKYQMNYIISSDNHKGIITGIIEVLTQTMKEVFVLIQERLTISHRKGHHLTEIEHGAIAALHAEGASNRDIAEIIGVCPQTINNELKRDLSRIVLGQCRLGHRFLFLSRFFRIPNKSVQFRSD